MRVIQSCPTLYGYSPWNSPGQNTGVGTLSLLQGLFPTQRYEPRSPTLQADPLPAEPQGKPKNTGVGSLFLFQGIFLTQELNQGLLHYRRILYQLSYKGNPLSLKPAAIFSSVLQKESNHSQSLTDFFFIMSLSFTLVPHEPNSDLINLFLTTAAENSHLIPFYQAFFKSIYQVNLHQPSLGSTCL